MRTWDRRCRHDKLTITTSCSAGWKMIPTPWLLLKWNLVIIAQTGDRRSCLGLCLAHCEDVTLIWSSCHRSPSHVILIQLLLLTITMTGSPMSGRMIVHSGNIIIVPTLAWLCSRYLLDSAELTQDGQRHRAVLHWGWHGDLELLAACLLVYCTVHHCTLPSGRCQL